MYTGDVETKIKFRLRFARRYTAYTWCRYFFHVTWIIKALFIFFDVL